jgi:hypothetical protein
MPIVEPMALAVLGWSSETWLALSTFATAVVLLGTALAGMSSLWDARRTRHATLMADLARRWSEPSELESRILFGEYGRENLSELIERIYGERRPSSEDFDAFWKLSAFPMLIEQIGVLRAERAISARVVYRMWGAQIVAAWVVWRDPIARMRELEGRTGLYAAFENLAREMQQQISAREGVTSAGAARAVT